MTQECTTKDLRCFFGLFLVVWIFCIVTFCQDLQKQLSWERTTGTVVDIYVGRGEYTHSRAVITFQTGSKTETEEIRFTSEADDATSSDLGRNDIVVVYNPKNPSRGPEVLDYVKTEVAISGCFGLFTTMLGVILTMYFCSSSDTLGQALGLREHLAPESASSAILAVQGVVT
jgi:hypothetical protein